MDIGYNYADSMGTYTSILLLCSLYFDGEFSS